MADIYELTQRCQAQVAGWSGMSGRMSPESVAGCVGMGTWRMNALTSLLFTASSDISDTTTTGSSGVLERRVGLEARHAFRTHLIGSAGLGMAKRDYTGIDIDETQYDITLGLDYYLNRDAAILARYQHTAFLSDFIDGDYTADEFRIALRLRR